VRDEEDGLGRGVVLLVVDVARKRDGGARPGGGTHQHSITETSRRGDTAGTANQIISKKKSHKIKISSIDQASHVSKKGKCKQRDAEREGGKEREREREREREPNKSFPFDWFSDQTKNGAMICEFMLQLEIYRKSPER